MVVFKVGDKVRVKKWGYKTSQGGKAELSGKVLTIKDIWMFTGSDEGRTQDFCVIENNYLWSNYQVDPLIPLTNKQREAKTKKIIKEIKGNKGFKSCFKNIEEEIKNWDDFKISNWK